jgi:hypothetical protein
VSLAQLVGHLHYICREQGFAVFLRLHTSDFDRAISVALLKELLRLVAGRCGSDDGGEANCGVMTHFM